jgi:PKD repeat protein
VFNNPTVNFSYNNPCEGEVANFNANGASPNGTITYTWDFGDGSGATGTSATHTYASLGEYTVIMYAEDASGCKKVIKKNLNYSSKPNAAFSINSGGVICTGSDAKFTNGSSNPNAIVGYEWDFGDNTKSISTNAVHEYNGSGAFTVKLKARNDFGCFTEATQNITVVDGVKLSFNTSGNCNGQTVSFSNTSVEPSGGGVNYSWNFGDGGISTDKDPQHTYGGIGSFTVKVLALTPSGCKSESQTSVLVGEKPVVFFSATKDKVCVGDEITLSNSSFCER